MTSFALLRRFTSVNDKWLRIFQISPNKTRLAPASSAALQINNRHYTNRNFLELSRRGLWKERYPENCAEFNKKLLNSSDPITLYAGFDPTADSLHIGNLLILISLIHCQRAGHNPIVLLGGFTATLGDPSGKKLTREGMAEAAARGNADQILAQIQGIFKNHEDVIWKNGDQQPLTAPRYVNNKDWIPDMEKEFIPILRHITAAQLLRSPHVKNRIDEENKLCTTELFYQIFQAYDWVHLYDKYRCILQVGGSDQMGNIYLGHDLLKEMRDVSGTGLSVHLVTDEKSGDKLGKSAGNAVWLSKDRTSYFDFYQHFIRRHDSEVEHHLKMFTFLPLGEIEKLMAQHWKNPGLQVAQKRLAECVTLLVHGEKGLQVALDSTSILYRNNAALLLSLSAEEVEGLFSGLCLSLPLRPGTTVAEAALQAGVFPNAGDCVAKIRAGGLSINQCRVTVPDIALVPDLHVLPSGHTLFRKGKQNYTLVRWLAA